MRDARLLLLDEPVAGMSHEERDATGALLETVSRDRAVVVSDPIRRYQFTLTAVSTSIVAGSRQALLGSSAVHPRTA